MQNIFGEASAIRDGQVLLIAFHFNKKCFSVRDAKSRRVITYVKDIALHDAQFDVSIKGRLRVLFERKKNVHAFIRGVFYQKEQKNILNFNVKGLRQAYYNPYTTEQFIDKETRQVIINAKIVYCTDKSVYYN
ncbi:hypothetical protein AB4Z45_22380 [Paenibacillus sp. MCAF9]|uniref:hypothetical protein n=1 Tax=Paenibacillus sp. MCAF9 TaxID=3233046 RepID=UPI003F9942E3